jgi:hypothetical protein
MPRSAGDPGRPSDHVEGVFAGGTPVEGAPVGIAELAAIAGALAEALAEPGRTVTQVARDSGLDRTTIYDIVAGRSVCDVVTLARLEHALGRRLYPEGELELGV